MLFFLFYPRTIVLWVSTGSLTFLFHFTLTHPSLMLQKIEKEKLKFKSRKKIFYSSLLKLNVYIIMDEQIIREKKERAKRREREPFDSLHIMLKGNIAAPIRISFFFLFHFFVASHFERKSTGRKSEVEKCSIHMYIGTQLDSKHTFNS